jgi:hypothetical protein
MDVRADTNSYEDWLARFCPLDVSDLTFKHEQMSNATDLPVCNTLRTRAALVAREFFRDFLQKSQRSLKLRRIVRATWLAKSLQFESRSVSLCNTHRTLALAPAVNHRVSLIASTYSATQWLTVRASATWLRD